MIRATLATLPTKLANKKHMGYHNKINTSFAKKLLLVLASVPLLFVGAISTAVAATIISEVTVLENNTLLRIEGEDFGSEPKVSISNYADTLIIVDEDCTLETSVGRP